MTQIHPESRWQNRWLAALFVRYVAFSERHTGALLLGLLSLAVLSLYPVSHLALHTDMAELLPDNHPAVVAMRTILPRQKASTNLVILVESPDAAANRRFAEALRPELTRMIPKVFTEIQWQPETEVPEYASHWRWLYADQADLESAESLLDRIVAHRSSPLLVDLEGDPEQEMRDLRKRLDAKLPAKPAKSGASDPSYFEWQDQGTHYLGVMLWRRGSGLAGMDDQNTLSATEEVVQRENPRSFHSAMKVEYTGAIAMAIDEHNAVRDDLTVATVVCSSMVLLVIFLYFRRVALLWVIGAPAVLGLLVALSLAYFTIHFLNANTAFLISIILGNGINQPIILLARYGEERRRGLPVLAALPAAMSATFLATITATSAASIAYGCLLITTFRGLNQFGLVGGSGMLLVWLMTFLLVPPMLIWGERRWPGRFTPRASLYRGPFVALGWLAERQPLLLAFVSLLLVAVAIPPTLHYIKDPLEWDLDKLRDSNPDGSRRWGIMYRLGMGNVGAGYIGTDGVLLVDTPEQADPVARALKDQDTALGSRSVLKDVRSLSSTLPQEQDEKLAILSRIRHKIDVNRERMGEDEWQDLQGFRPPEYLRRLTVPDLPRRIREAFTEIDEQVGRLVGIDADPTRYNAKNGRELLRMAKSMQVNKFGKTWTAASPSTIFAAMLAIIVDDGPRVTLAALCGVTALVVVAFGWRGAFPVLLSLGTGLVWLGGLLWHFKLRLNFVNFVALPITLGVGADYAANIWARLRSEGVQHLGRVIADTGSAVALCSITTIIGYSSLLLARSQALKSFGMLADLGEVTCLLAALVALPAIVRLTMRGKE